MNKSLKSGAVVLAALVLVIAWVVYFHNGVVAGVAPKWDWLQGTIKYLGKFVPEPPPEDEDPDNTKNHIPVRVAQVKVGTVRRTIEGFGIVVPRQAQKGEMSGGANIAAPAAGVVAKVNCVIGQQVHAGDLLIELDGRLAKAAEDQAAAALTEAEAGEAALNAAPRPVQIEIAQLAIEKARAALEFAQKNYDRQKLLAAGQGVAGKTVEQAATDLAAANSDMTVAQKELALLQADPRPEDLRQAHAKVQQAAAALAAAKMQTQLLAIGSPIDGTVVSIGVNPGEAVDPARVIVSVIAMDRLMVDVDVPADQLPVKPEGLPTEITLAGAVKKGQEVKAIMGEIAYVSPQVEPKNGAVMVSIKLPADSGLRPGLTVRTRLIVEEHKDALLAPRQAVVADENGDHVISIVTGEQAVHRNIEIGLEENGMIEIISDGVKEGTAVVTEGAFGLRSTQATHIKVVE